MCLLFATALDDGVIQRFGQVPKTELIDSASTHLEDLSVFDLEENLVDETVEVKSEPSAKDAMFN